MRSEHEGPAAPPPPDEGAEDPAAPDPVAPEADDGAPLRLDAAGMPVDPDHPLSGAPHPEPPEESGPSLRLPVAVAALGTVLLVLAVAQLIQAQPEPGQARPMTPAVLAAALALGGFSATRMLQLRRLAGSRRRRAAAGQELPAVRWQLAEEHSLHAVWLLGVAGSVALMGLLGLWSLLDARPSGLEPGWHLLLLGAVLAGGTHRVRRQLETLWKQLAL